MGWDNVHGRDVQDCPVHGHELCNVQDMSRTFYIHQEIYWGEGLRKSYESVSFS